MAKIYFIFVTIRSKISNVCINFSVSRERGSELHFKINWGKKKALAAGSLFAASVLFLSGCGTSGTVSKNAGSAPAAVSAQAAAADPSLKPGVAVVHRSKNVKYSVPEGVSVLMYHMIGDAQDNAAIMSEDNLRLQMNYLRDHGYHPITLEELYDYVTKGAPLPENRYVLLLMTDTWTVIPWFIRS